MKCDVCEESDIMSVFSAVKSQFGGIDVCVNNAGLAYNAPLLTGETKDWRTMLEVIINRFIINLNLKTRQMYLALV